MEKSVIIGMGIGKLYYEVLSSMGHKVITVDPVQKADYKDIDKVPVDIYDTIHICTPNHTHEQIAKIVAPWCNILYIEKPGLENASAWKRLRDNNPDCKIVMVKNNQYRDNIDELAEMARVSSVIDLNWSNKNRVPNPGTWFTNKELAFGGVSRDLMPHLFSLYQMLNPDYKEFKYTDKLSKQNWQLKDLLDTDYGTVNQNGVHNVDDESSMKFKTKFCEFNIMANWRNDKENDIGINFHMFGNIKRIELGLCPEDAYKRMIETGKKNLKNNEYWENEFIKDMWIHERLEEL